MRNFIILLFIFWAWIPTAHSQIYWANLQYNGTGDLVMPLGKYKTGMALTVTYAADGNYAVSGGIYHLSGDWDVLPKVVYRAEHAKPRMTFYAYLDPSSSGYLYLFAKWENLSPAKASENLVRVYVSSMSEIIWNQNGQNGSFGNATPLGSVYAVHSNTANVGIGTTNPDAKLTVKGRVHAEEVKVDLAVPAPDYVFEETYELPTLRETEAYIKQHRHLPEIPSAKEMEAKGLDLGTMNMLLLKKIEELTLHQIEQQRQIDALKEENMKMKNAIGALGGEK